MPVSSARPQLQTVEVAPEVPPPPAPPATPPPPSRPQIHFQGHPSFLRHLNFVIPGLFLVITIFTASFVTQRYLQSRRPQTNSSLVPAPTLLPAAPPPTLKPVTKTKTFSGSRVGFSFEYSEELNLTECEDAIYLYLDGSFSCARPGSFLIALRHAATNFYPNLDFPANVSIQEDLIELDHQDAIRHAYDNSVKITFSRKGTYYLFESDYYQGEHSDLVSSVLTTFQFFDDITADWSEHRSTYFYLKYPSNWTLSPSTSDDGLTTISQDPAQPKLHVFSLDFSSGNADAELSANQLIDSAKAQTGWTESPQTDLRNIGGGTAQVLQGHFDNYWHTVVVIWYKDQLAQISWYDTLDRSQANVFDGLLSSFIFLQ